VLHWRRRFVQRRSSIEQNGWTTIMSKLCLALALPGFLRVIGFVVEPLLSDTEIHRIAGEPARVNRPVPDPAHLSVVTWNIERGQAYDAILRVLSTLDADVLLLQEVDRGCHRTGYRDVARDLAHALGMNWVSGGEFQEIGEGRNGTAAITGQAILSKQPIDAVAVLRFQAQARWKWSINPAQPRRGGRMTLKARTAGVRFYNTHIESGGNDSLQRNQIGEILADEARAAAEGIPVVIGGDFNNGPVLRASMFGRLTAAAFADALGKADGRGPTSQGQLHPIDWIFIKIASSTRGRIVQAQAASDHSPLFVALSSAPAFAAAR
jgi:endonuclease/exonuclease/phosphatase family metal-dependent hydrolase